MNRPKHTLVAFMDEVHRSMQADYHRIRARAGEDPGTAGDEGEESWAELLRSWLPATYPVVTKGRILNADGEASPQVDVLVLHPAYPQHLRNRKLYLADGVVAAFECKLTLRGRHIPAAVETAAALKRLYRRRLGTPYKELHQPIIYGLLAHSCDYSGSAFDITFKVQARVERAFEDGIEHPSEMLDVVCVADSGHLYLAHDIAIGADLAQFCSDPSEYQDSDIGVVSWFFGRSIDRPADTEGGAVGHFLSYVLRRMAWEDVSLQRLSNYFDETMRGGGIARPSFWRSDVLSDRVIRRLLQRGCSQNGWSEWHNMF